MSREHLAILLVVLPMVVLSATVGWWACANGNGVVDGGAVVFNLTGVASDGVWTVSAVNGLNYWWKSFEPATLMVTVGDEVVIHLRSADVFHRFYIPAFDVGPVGVEPGHMETVRFTADRPGVYQYYCTSMCGGCHFYMRGWLVVTAPGDEPVSPPPIMCTLCRPEGHRPGDFRSLVELGSWMYLEKGCVTCHGFEGQGGVVNPNSANSPVPDHATTAQKLFLASPEDAAAFIDLMDEGVDLHAVEEAPEISRFPVVRTRFDNARQIVRGGRYSSKLDPHGPEPPLQMPAWRYILEEGEIDALLVYFVSLYQWEEG